MNKPQSKSQQDKLLKYFWPHPYPQSHPPIQVTFSNGIPESDDDPIHKVFVIPYSLFERALQSYIDKVVTQARIDEWQRTFHITDTWEDSPKGVGIRRSDIYARISELKAGDKA